ncbi:MAG: membrane protein [Firmicutes bacterium]|nr:membrane protein [Bacillota bacterium]
MGDKKEWILIIRKLPSLFFGLFLYAVGMGVVLYASLGTSPWETFSLGIINYIPLTFGQASQIIGLFVLVASFFIGVIPGIGSILNMYFIGFFFDLVDNMGMFKTPVSLVGKLFSLIIGIFILGWGTYFYLRVELGAGPRDGLMEGLVKKFQKPVWLIRGVIEITVLTIGYFLGAPVGVGTLITAFTVGFSVQLAFKIGKYDSRTVEHENVIIMFKRLSSKEEKAV